MAEVAAFICTQPAQFRRKLPSTQSSPRGNEIDVFADAEPILVWGWYIGDDLVPMEGHAQRVQIDATCYPPTTLGTKVGDRIELPGKGWFKVEGVSEYDAHPNFTPGIVDVKLRRVKG